MLTIHPHQGAGLTTKEAQECRQDWFQSKRIRKELWA